MSFLRSTLRLRPKLVLWKTWKSVPSTLPSKYLHSGTNEGLTFYKTRRDSWFSPTMLIVGFIPFFTFGLGTWQLQRLQWKIALIEELEEKLQLEPMSLPSRINLSVIPEFIFRKVLVTGRWDHSRSILLGPRVWEGVTGFHVVIPLVRTDGSTILVDRGFISKDFVEQYLSPEEEDEVEVLGMLRMSQTRNTFTPDNDPDAGIWHWADVNAMSEHAGGVRADVQPVFVEEIFEGHAGDAVSRLSKGIPIGRAPTVDLRNAHLSYVITWYSLSVFTTAMFIRLLVNKRRSVGRKLPR